MFTTDVRKSNGNSLFPGYQLPVYQHESYYRFSDLVEFFGITETTAASAERLLSRPNRGSSSLPIGMKCGRHIIVRGCDFTRAIEWAEKSAARGASAIDNGGPQS